MWPFHPPVERVMVLRSKSTTASQALGRHQMFVTLCMRWGVSVVKTEGQAITVKGKPRKLERFCQEFVTLSEAGAI